jgi:hypothetical protein
VLAHPAEVRVRVGGVEGAVGQADRGIDRVIVHGVNRIGIAA